MLEGSSEIPEISELIRRSTLRVHSPADFILVCGGQYDVQNPTPASLRDTYLREQSRFSVTSKFATNVPEDFSKEYINSGYTNLLEFESDLAQISSLLLVFSESYGSAVELGAFSVIPEISSRLLVMIDDKRYTEDSFVKLGPLASLIERNGRSSVCVLNLNQLGISNIKHLQNLETDIFMNTLSDSIVTRIDKIKSNGSSSKFSSSNVGHCVFLLVGLVQYYGALTVEELEVHANEFQLKLTALEIEKYMTCAIAANWISKHEYGSRDFYAARNSNGKRVLRECLQFETESKFDKISWRAKVRQFYKTSQPNRFDSIQQAVAL